MGDDRLPLLYLYLGKEMPLIHSARLYLFRSEVRSFVEALHSAREGWQEHALRGHDPRSVALWIKPNHPTKPTLIDRYSGLINLQDVLENKMSSSVMLFLVNGRVFAECTGHGHALLIRHKLSADFGAVLTSRFGDPSSFKRVESRTYGQLLGSNRVHRPRGGIIESMVPNGVFFDVTSIAMSPGPGGTTGRLEEGGAGYLDRSSFKSIEERIAKLEVLLGEYEGGSQLPPSITLAKPVRLPRDSAESEELYRTMLAEIAEGNSQGHLEFWVPFDTDTSQSGDCVLEIGSIRIGPEVADWADLDAIWRKRADWTVSSLLNTQVRVLRDGEVIASPSLLACLHMETVLNDESYFHDEAQWIRISPEYILSAERRIQEFETPFSSIGLLPWKDGWTEDEFNDAAGRADGWHCIHPATWRGGGMRSGVELADIIDITGRLMHVKKYERISQLAYLLNQVRIAADCLSLPTGAREFINDHRLRIGQPMMSHVPDRLVIGIGSNRFAKVSDVGSAGAKIALAKTLGELWQLGFRAELIWIPME